VPRKPQSAQNSQVLDELEAIDTSLLQQLIDLRTEQTRLDQYRKKAAELKGKVEENVWKRVVADYGARATKLESQAAPLKVEVQREYKKLRALRDRIVSTLDQARLAKEELEFRHAVGELSEAELAEKLADPTGVLDSCNKDLAAVDGRKAKFVEAFGSEADLESITDPAMPAEPAGSAPPAEEGGSAKDRASEDATGFAPPVEAPAEEAEPVSTGQLDRTFILPRAAVFVSVADGEPTEFRLAAINFLGRLEDNHIQLARPGVSRKHAVIEASASGFTLKDLGSQNGTYLNGERVDTHELADGDRIVIGDAQILYRIPWPAAGESSVHAS